jgi:hypothetical protein
LINFFLSFLSFFV